MLQHMLYHGRYIPTNLIAPLEVAKSFTASHMKTTSVPLSSGNHNNVIITETCISLCNLASHFGAKVLTVNP